MKRILATLLLASMLLPLAAACDDDDGDTPSTATPAASVTAAAPATATSAATPAASATPAELPAIVIDTPQAGARVGSPLRVTGSSNVFEATTIARIVDAASGELAEQVVTATSGTGTRGTFDASIAFTVDVEQPGKLIMFEPSARDGTPQNIVEVPLILTPQQ